MPQSTPLNSFTPQATADGSFTFFSAEFQESFHSHYGAGQEAEYKFVIPCLLAQQASKPRLKILDICYGLGYNSAAALAKIWQVNPHCQVDLIALESDLAVPQKATAHNLLNIWQQPVPQLLTELASKQKIITPTLQAQLLIGDARSTIQSVYQSGWQADAIFLDPFSPPKCPQLWTVEFLTLVSKCLKQDGRLATYSCSAAVRGALCLAGLKFGSTECVGRRTPGTVADFNGKLLKPLSAQEQEHLKTRAAIPYRDPNLRDSTEIIKQRRDQEQKLSHLETTTQWKKRWSKGKVIP